MVPSAPLVIDALFIGSAPSTQVHRRCQKWQTSWMNNGLTNRHVWCSCRTPRRIIFGLALRSGCPDLDPPPTASLERSKAASSGAVALAWRPTQRHMQCKAGPTNSWMRIFSPCLPPHRPDDSQWRQSLRFPHRANSARSGQRCTHQARQSGPMHPGKTGVLCG